MYDIKIIESLRMVKDGPPITIPRTWKERLFTLPWRPLQTTKIVITKIPSDEVFVLLDGTYVCHPEVAKQIRKHFKERIIL